MTASVKPFKRLPGRHAPHLPQAVQKEKRPDGGNRQGVEIVTLAVQSKGVPVKNNTSAAPQQSAVILLHPNHAGPKVENARRPGPKKGVISLNKARFNRRILRLAEKGRASSAPAAPSLDSHRLAGYLAGATNIGWAAAYQVASAAMQSLDGLQAAH